jgi:UDP-2,3-diacylglucosamine pyrophosphatase LpxH
LNVDQTVSLGDLYDTEQCKYRKIRKAHKELVNYLDSINIQYVSGNHDSSIFFRNSITIKFGDGQKALGIHADQYDKKMRNYFFKKLKWFIGIPERIPGLGDIDNPKKSKVLLKKKYKECIKDVEDFAKGYLAKGYNIVFCAHTHNKILVKYNPLHMYVNVGDCMHGEFGGALLETETREVVLI